MITSGQPSSNPRIVKEAVALSEYGYQVTVLYCFWAAWANPNDEEIKQRLPQIEWVEMGGNPQTSVSLYTYTRLRHKFFRTLNTLFPSNLYISARAGSRAFSELLRAAKKEKADLYIAHNLGALAVAAKAANANPSQYAFDAEDFHRGEVGDQNGAYRRIKYLEDTFLPDAGYITAASPLIADNYAAIYKRNVPTINNVFSLKYQTDLKLLPFDVLKLVWFSQTIGLNRGIQDILAAANEVQHRKLHITLVGLCDKKTERELRKVLVNEMHSIHFLKPLREADLFALCSDHHIGLALERSEPYNRNICLTNKLFTYLIAGNAIIASDTLAQRKFIDENNSVGFLYRMGDVHALKQLLIQFTENEQRLTETRKAAHRLAQLKYNWENEGAKLTSVLCGLSNQLRNSFVGSMKTT